MTILGAVLAGGSSTRFGSDKAVALHDGRRLLDHALAALAPQVAALVVCGRDWPGAIGIADHPHAGLGPLGGLNAALHHAIEHGFDAVLTSGCDLLDIPPDLGLRLAPGPAVAVGQPLLGLWPVGLAAALDAQLQGHDRSLRAWVAACGARLIDCGVVRNINRLADLN